MAGMNSFLSPEQRNLMEGLSGVVGPTGASTTPAKNVYAPQIKTAYKPSPIEQQLTTNPFSTLGIRRSEAAPQPEIKPEIKPGVSEDQKMMNLQGSPYAPNMDIQRPARMVREVVHHDRVPTKWGVSPEGNTTMSGGYTPNDTVQQVRVNPNVDTRVDLGGGSYFQAPKETITPAMSMGMQRAAVPSTPEELARRERDVSQVEANNARYGDGKDGQNPGASIPQNGGGGMPQRGQRDYSGIIEQAINTLNKPSASGSFDRMIGQKKEKMAAQAVLNAIGGMQTAEGQQATQRDVAAMGDQTDRAKAAMANKTAQERTAAEQEQERQRSALGMASLTSQDQERQSRMGLAKAQFDREGQLAEQGAQQLNAQRGAAMNFFNEKANEGIFGNEEAAQYAQLVGTGAMSPAEAFKLFNSKK